MGLIKYVALGCGVVTAILILIITIFVITGWRKYYAVLRTAETKCNEYKKLACDHKLPLKPDVGREDPAEGLFPHMAFIVNKNDKKFNCSGALISDRFVLTTAHCTITTKRAKVKLGSLTSKENDTGEWFNVAAEYRIPWYKDDVDVTNIGLLKLDEAVKFSPYVRPICLSTNPEFIETDLFASGWSTDEGDRSFQRLRVIDLRASDVDAKLECKKHFLQIKLFTSLFHCSVHMLRNKTACPRTKGGPAQYKFHSECPNSYAQFGIATRDIFFKQCENRTEGPVVALHVQLHSAIAWISEKVWPQ